MSITNELNHEARSICCAIERLLRVRRNDDKSINNDATNTDAGSVKAKRELISNARQWVENVFSKCDWRRNVQDDSARQRQRATASSDALALILRTLDDVDVANLLSAAHRNRSNKRMAQSRRLLDPQQIVSYGETSSAPRKRRRKMMPHRTKSMDVVQAMHEAQEAETTDDENENSNNFYLSNTDRHKRAKQRLIHLQSQKEVGCSMRGISIKAVMNAADDNIPKAMEEEQEEKENEHVISTLTHDAALLRRDLYKYLAILDTAEIGRINRRRQRLQLCTGSDTHCNYECKLSTRIKELASTLLQRIASNPTSPSMRLSSIITLDSLREMELSDRGYRCLLEELLDGATTRTTAATDFFKFFAEIASECSVYEKPLRLLRVISNLMKQAIQKQPSQEICNDRGNDVEELKETTPLLLRTISHIIVRRQNTLSSLNKDNDTTQQSSLRTEIGIYKSLCTRISVCHDSLSSWISPTMPANVRENVIAALQANSILSLFCHGDDINDEDQKIGTSAVEEYPYPRRLSLRSAHDRMGPCDGFNRLLSHPATYEHCPPSFPLTRSPSQSSTKKSMACPLSDTNDDILVIIFSYLGYRSLSRASQCCLSWNRASKAKTLWVSLYFKKYRKAYFEEELALGIENGKNHVHFGKFLSFPNSTNRQQLALAEEGYDWNYIFKRKYAIEKSCRWKTCSVIGCPYVIRRDDYAQSHMRRHESAMRAKKKRYDNYETMQQRVTKLKQQMNVARSQQYENVLEQPRMHKIESPYDVLRCAFSYLDVKDVVKPICRLWTRMARCNELWKSLYVHRFGVPCTAWLTTASITAATSPTRDWKMLFKSAFVANCNTRGRMNDFGWKARICPVLGCMRVLKSPLEHDVHLLKHEELYYLHQKKQMSKKCGRLNK